MFGKLLQQARKRRNGGKSKRDLAEAVDLVKRYARQELLDPLKGVPRWLGLGLLGSFGMILGMILLLLALLRALQTETGTALTGNLSWIPYLVTVAALLAVIVLLVRQISKKSL